MNTPNSHNSTVQKNKKLKRVYVDTVIVVHWRPLVVIRGKNYSKRVTCCELHLSIMCKNVMIE